MADLPVQFTPDPNQDAIVQLDLDHNQLTTGPAFDQALDQAPQVIAQAQQLLATKLDDIDEAKMTALNKQFKPLRDYEKQFTDVRKQIKKELTARNDRILSALDAKLTAAGFDQLPDLTRQFRQLQKDFKENRANQRWQLVSEMFAANLQAYPELLEPWAKDTLGSFEFFRLHHPDLVSSAKTKPVTEKTQITVNQLLNDYHQDLQRLLNATPALDQQYWGPIVTDYAADPSTDRMLKAIHDAQVKQTQAQQAALQTKVRDAAQVYLVKNWHTNTAMINYLLKQPDFPADLVNKHQADLKTLLTTTGQAMVQGLTAGDFIDANGDLLMDQLHQHLAGTCKTSLVTVMDQFQAVLTKAQAQAQPQPAKQPEAKPAQPVPKPTNPNSWFLDYLQANHWEQIAGNDGIKLTVINDLMQGLQDPQSVWYQHLSDARSAIALIRKITTL